MATQLPIDDQLREQLQQTGEVQVQDSHGTPLVLMTATARERLARLVYDDSEWTEAEQNAMLAEALKDPEGWGAPDMDEYDALYGDEAKGNGPA